MSERHWIAIQELCNWYALDPQVLLDFAEEGLFTLYIEQEVGYLDASELSEVESLIRLFQRFAIPAEGLDVIRHLRRQVQELRTELVRAEHRLAAARQLTLSRQER
ncbi:MAG: chaperone modulator CbpM [Candidatus Sericytochromatia bacterium]